MRFTARAALIAASIIAGGGAGAFMPQLPTPVPIVQQSRRQSLRSFARSLGIAPRKRGPGWTHAHVQRMARKRRNQARHRSHCQRKGRR